MLFCRTLSTRLSRPIELSGQQDVKLTGTWSRQGMGAKKAEATTVFRLHLQSVQLIKQDHDTPRAIGTVPGKSIRCDVELIVHAMSRVAARHPLESLRHYTAGKKLLPRLADGSNGAEQLSIHHVAFQVAYGVDFHVHRLEPMTVWCEQSAKPVLPVNQDHFLQHRIIFIVISIIYVHNQTISFGRALP